MSADKPFHIHEPAHPGRTDQLAGDLAGERLIGRAEFQELLGVGQSTLERWRASGRLPEPIRLSRTCHRWKLSVVLQWISDGCPQPVGRARR
jgi:predicted DNA-binding transcriptional regulator AlpA